MSSRHDWDDCCRHCGKCPPFVTRPRSGKSENGGEGEILPLLVLNPPDQVIKKAGGAEDHQWFVFGSGEQIDQMGIQGEHEKCQPALIQQNLAKEFGINFDDWPGQLQQSARHGAVTQIN